MSHALDLTDLFLVGVLLYFSDGLLPLLTAYYKDFFEPPKEGYMRERQMAISAKIAKALLVSTCRVKCITCMCQPYPNAGNVRGIGRASHTGRPS